jgi:hypothetical protein
LDDGQIEGEGQVTRAIVVRLSWIVRAAASAASTAVLIAVLCGAGRPSTAVAQRSSAPESVAVRVKFLSSGAWGAEPAHCTAPDWGWDSLTWRVRSGQPVPHAFMFSQPEFRIGRTFAPDSAWLCYRARYLAPVGHERDPSRAPDWDSLIVTSRWTPTLTTIGVYDAQKWFRVRLVAPWPEARPSPIETASLRGIVVDDSTGRTVSRCHVVVDGTRLDADADSLGRFVLANVPVGQRDIYACSARYMPSHAVVRVPSAPIEIRLRRESRGRFTRTRR